ncbi:MAG: DUF4159 domain-containing protein, partial [Planctomycetes bacterium]|nr:DUF4159 domain-containing protein [Planctomycetota bacterium]
MNRPELEHLVAPRFARHTLRAGYLVAGCLAGLIPAAGFAQPGASTPGSVTDADVELAIRRGVESVWAHQGTGGRWIDPRWERFQTGGLTALAAFALRTAGVERNDPRLRRAVNYLLENDEEIRTNYARSFRLMLWVALDPQKYRPNIQADVRHLAGQQNRQGAWGYGGQTQALMPRGFADNSNSQLVILALWEASQVGGEVNRIIWQRAEEAWLACQNEDGGWGYNPVENVNVMRPDSYGSMTAAGLATMYILYDRLYARSAGRFDGYRARNCGRQNPQTRAIRSATDRAWNWLNLRFVPERIPAIGQSVFDLNAEWLTYYLYSVERAGVASGYKTFGVNDWYRDLATHLVRTQDPDGGWGNVSQTCFALLALVKGRTPIVINKLRFGRDGDWNNASRDAAGLTRWLSRKLEAPLTWQIVELDQAEAGAGDAPILYLSGHQAPVLSERERQGIADYVSSGGTVLAVACCSRTSFSRGIEGVFDQLFPRLRRHTLGPEHPVWTMQYRLRPTDQVVGYSDGCRTRLFVVTRGINLAWQQNLHDRYEDRFRLGANLLHYATNRTSPRSLGPGFGFGSNTGPNAADHVGGGTAAAGRIEKVTVGRVQHGGDFWTDPLAMSALSARTGRSLRLHLEETAAVALETDDLERFDLLWLTGHTLVAPREAGAARLETYLEGGGTLAATACCGRAAFDASFTALMERMYGSDALVALQPDDPLITGRLGPDPTGDRAAVLPPLGSDLGGPHLRRGRNTRWRQPTSRPTEA